MVNRFVQFSFGYVVWCLLSTPAANAQTVNLTANNATATIVGTVFSNNLGNANWIIDPGALDQLFQYNWYYRSPVDNTNRVFSSLDTPTVVQGGNNARITYTNAGPGASGVARFDAVIDVTLVDDATPNTGNIQTGVTFTASQSNATAQTFHVFNLVDIDLSGSVTNDIASLISATEARIGITESDTSNFAQHVGFNANRFEYGLASTLRSNMVSGAYNLSNTVGATLPLDIASAFQWTFTLNPGQSIFFQTAFSINRVASVPEPGSIALVSAGLGSVLARWRRRKQKLSEAYFESDFQPAAPSTATARLPGFRVVHPKQPKA